MLRIGLFGLSFLFLKTAAFGLSPPPSVYIADQFQVNWTWLTSEPTNIVVVLNDVSRAPDCPTDTSQREGSYVILDLANRAGKLGMYVKKEATFQTCAFSYKPGSVTPVTNIQALLAKSNTFKSSVFGTTVTVQPTSTSTLTPPSVNSSSSSSTTSIAGPVVGGVIGGLVFLILVIWLSFFKIAKKYQVIRLPLDDNNPSSDPLLMNTVNTTSIGHIHPGVSPFPHPSTPGSTSVTDLSPPTTASLKGRFREHMEKPESTGASGSGAGNSSRAGTPVRGLGHKSQPSTDTRDGSGSGTGTGASGSGRASDVMIMSTPLREGKGRDVFNR